GFIGRSYMDAPEVDGDVYVEGQDICVGDFVNVEITGAMEYDLIGVAAR
ncbi:MAG: 30S ribosomal protein S12 methylthiotransferase RimO, partial [Candidatus Omnitrophica bacterium]|nr:30S ribosomal protein S12 methylthiotransferase RimO [Candidatus Omnitrophota bacterium]